VGVQRHAPAALPPRKTRYLLYRKLGGPQGRSGRERKIFLPPTGIRSPDRPARSESLNRLSYPGPHVGISVLMLPCVMVVRCFGCLCVLSMQKYVSAALNPLNPELNPICYLLALLGAHHFLHVSRIRVKLLTFRLLRSYIYGAPILDVSRSHTTTQHSR